MGRLMYTALMSLDGYIADEDGKFDWAMPGEDAHQFINELERSVGTQLYGRRLYEVMVAWETMHTAEGLPPVMLEFAEIWQAAEKIVFSKTLDSVSSARTRIEREFDPESVRQMKSELSHDISIGGADLGAQAFRTGLVDECHLFIAPVVIGGGKSALPDGIRLNLQLMDEHRFANGMVHLHYQCLA